MAEIQRSSAKVSNYTASKNLPPKAEKEPPDVVRFTVYGEPVAKERARTVTTVSRRGRKRTHSYTPDKTASQEQNIALVYKSIYHGARFQRGISLSLSATFFFKIPKRTSKKNRDAMLAGELRPAHRPDVDNCIKTVADSLNKVLYEDDSQIVEMSGRKYYSDTPRTEVCVARIGKADLAADRKDNA